MAEQNGTIPITPGSTIKVEHTERRMKFYMVHENELNNLSGAHRRETTFWTLAGSLSAFSVGIFLDQFFVAVPTDAIKILSWVVSPAVLGVGIIFAFLAYGETRDRRRRKTAIEEESKVRVVDVP